MAAVMPAITPWSRPPRGRRDGVNDRQPKMSAPQQPGSVTYRSLRGLRCCCSGEVLVASAVACRAPSAVAARFPAESSTKSECCDVGPTCDPGVSPTKLPRDRTYPEPHNPNRTGLEVPQ